MFPAWILMFCTLCEVLSEREFGRKQMSVERCCKNGRVYALSSQHCDSLPLEPQPFCRMAQKQCCQAALRESFCTSGMKSANRNGVCDVLFLQTYPYEVNTAKMCCECCVLGLLAQKENHTCELQIPVTVYCRNVARICCLANQHGVVHQDYHECLSGSHRCRSGERCINLEGSYRCQRETSCGPGYELTNTNSCQDINECVYEKIPCPSGHTCINTLGSYRCQKFSVTCGRGYHLNKEGTHCMDVDECTTSHSACQDHDCVNLVGSFRCDCRSGFTFNSIRKTCEDYDECKSYPERLCAHNCDNTPGSYLCSCRPGFKLTSDGKSCEDVNECEKSPCSHECVNVYGSYQCYCHHGYQLNNMDRHACEDIDECALKSGSKVCSYYCLNTPGSYECNCPPTGYTLSPSGRTCLDIDECATGAHNCSSEQSCFNILGGFRCMSFECPSKYQRAAESHCERLPCEENSECHSLPLRISFYNLTFPTNIPVPAAVFRMGPSSSVPGDNIQVFLLDGDTEGYFSIQKTSNGAVVSLQRPLLEPRDFLLTVEIRMIRYGIESIFVAKIAVFVVKDQLIVPNSWPTP